MSAFPFLGPAGACFWHVGAYLSHVGENLFLFVGALSLPVGGNLALTYHVGAWWFVVVNAFGLSGLEIVRSWTRSVFVPPVLQLGSPHPENVAWPCISSIGVARSCRGSIEAREEREEDDALQRHV